MIEKILAGYKSVTILNGTLPSERIIKQLTNNKIIIGADSSQELILKNIVPDILIGDFDSRNINSVAEIIEDNDQYTTDFEKSIRLLRERQLTPSLVIGFSGGEIDHILGNIHSLIKHHQSNEELFFIDQDNKGNIKLGVVVSNYFETFHSPGYKVSIFPFQKAIISTEGLKYPLVHQLIEQTAGTLAIRNETITEEKVKIKVDQGIILVVFDITYIFHKDNLQ